jgi:hypothetical protein
MVEREGDWPKYGESHDPNQNHWYPNTEQTRRNEREKIVITIRRLGNTPGEKKCIYPVALSEKEVTQRCSGSKWGDWEKRGRYREGQMPLMCGGGKRSPFTFKMPKKTQRWGKRAPEKMITHQPWNSTHEDNSPSKTPLNREI